MSKLTECIQGEWKEYSSVNVASLMEIIVISYFLAHKLLLYIKMTLPRSLCWLWFWTRYCKLPMYLCGWGSGALLFVKCTKLVGNGRM